MRVARTDLGQDEHDRLEDDEDPIQDSPEGAARLIGNGARSRMGIVRNSRSLIQRFAYGI